MKLQSLISLLFSAQWGWRGSQVVAIHDSRIKIYFKTKEDLERSIDVLIKKLRDSDEELSNDKSIINYLLSNVEQHQYIPDIDSFYEKEDLIKELREKDPEKYGLLYRLITQEKFEELARADQKYFMLTEDSFYQIFSKGQLRKITINKIVIN